VNWHDVLSRPWWQLCLWITIPVVFLAIALIAEFARDRRYSVPSAAAIVFGIELLLLGGSGVFLTNNGHSVCSSTLAILAEKQCLKVNDLWTLALLALVAGIVLTIIGIMIRPTREGSQWVAQREAARAAPPLKPIEPARPEDSAPRDPPTPQPARKASS
jgi:hypothetical protein